MYLRVVRVDPAMVRVYLGLAEGVPRGTGPAGPRVSGRRAAAEC